MTTDESLIYACLKEIHSCNQKNNDTNRNLLMLLIVLVLLVIFGVHR